ncbi:nucleolar complex protein 14 [Geranomyces variabilis]|uniref:Nucleolar complex protein 14 n=1 Tax=Geranomyces variabilis TaxID=109894 RepID=A0AAD5XPK5_9FUNG|nr:nucleolar complex protein 14 [Geranomyces variabilis]
MGKQASTSAAGKQPKGGSALKRLKASLKDAGVIGKHQKISKKKTTTQRAAALGERKEAREILRGMSTKSRDNNPFEVKVNRQKHDVLGRKVKGSTGKPGLVRKRGEENRKRTLAVEMDRKNKDSAFVDRRFGENDASMSMEDKMLERFMKEKSKRSDRGNAFNLEDDDDDGMMELTHMGQSLNAFDDAGLKRVPGDEDEGSDSGQIDKDTVKYTHFGGFSEDEGEDDGTGKRKSKNEVMKEVIAKSKLHKRERQMLKEKDEDLADELDAQLDDIRKLLVPSKPAPFKAYDGITGATDSNTVPVSNKRGQDAASVEQKKTKRAREEDSDDDDDDYDRFVRELAAERRAKPTDRLKTEEELVRDEAARLEQLEKDRKRRMLGLPTEKEEEAQKKEARKAALNDKRPAQADDLGDADYVAAIGEQIEDAEEKPLVYKDGRLLNKEVFMRKTRKMDEEENEEEEEEVEEESDVSSEEEDEDEDDDNEDDDDDEDEASGAEGSESKEEWAVEDVTDALGEDAESDDDSELIEAAEAADSKKSAFVPKKRTVHPAAAKELPYTFKAPETHADFLELVQDRTAEEQSTIVQRIRALHHVKLGGDNRRKLERLLDVLLEHLIYLTSADQTSVDLAAANALSIPVIELAQQFPEQAAEHFLARIAALQKKLGRDLEHPVRRNSALPQLDTLITFKLIGRIFSTSDLVHPVAMPAMLLMAQYLSQCPLVDRRGALSGLFLCEIFAEYQAQSKRFVPEVVNFIAVALALILPTDESDGTASFPTVPIIDPSVTLFRIGDWKTASAQPSTSSTSLLQTLATINSSDTSSLSEADKYALLTATVKILGRTARLLMEQPSFIEIFAPFPSYLDRIPSPPSTATIASVLSATQTLLSSVLTSAAMKRRPLLLQKFKPIPMSTFVPKFDAHYSMDHKSSVRDPDRDRVEQAKLKAEYKKEHKGAVRELRKDAAFIARKRMQNIKEKDVEYKKKMDKIMGGLANQEGAMRGYERELKKAKGQKP